MKMFPLVKLNFPTPEEFEQNKADCGQILGWGEVPTEVIYCIEKVGKITMKAERVIMVVSLVDEDGASFKEFTTSCHENDLRDFS